MIGNYYILFCSSLLIILLAFYFSRRSPEVDIIDVYIIFIILHFGAYPFVRGLHFGKDLILDFTNADLLSIGLVFVQVLIVLVILKLLSLFFIKNMYYLKVRYLVKNYSQVNKYVLSSFYVFVLVFLIFSYYKYGIKSYIKPDEFKLIGKSLPYWFTSFRTIYNCLTFCIFLVLLSYTLTAKDYKYQILWLVLTIFFIPFAAMFGKRFFINILIIATIFYFSVKNEKLFQLRNIKYGIFLMVFTFLFCNLFQEYRGFLENMGKATPDNVLVRDMRNPLSAAIHFQPTLEALANRPGTWEFSYLVIDKQIRDGIKPTNGRIIKENIKSTIPKFLWPDKSFFLTDDMLAQIYGVRPKEIDIGKNIFGMMQLDYGYLSIVLVPLIILAVLILMGFINKITANYPVFFWLFSGNFLFYFVNIEENGNELFYMLRNILLLSLLFIIFIFCQKMYSIIRERY